MLYVQCNSTDLHTFATICLPTCMCGGSTWNTFVKFNCTVTQVWLNIDICTLITMIINLTYFIGNVVRIQVNQSSISQKCCVYCAIATMCFTLIENLISKSGCYLHFSWKTKTRLMTSNIIFSKSVYVCNLRPSVRVCLSVA